MLIADGAISIWVRLLLQGAKWQLKSLSMVVAKRFESSNLGRRKHHMKHMGHRQNYTASEDNQIGAADYAKKAGGQEESSDCRPQQLRSK